MSLSFQRIIKTIAICAIFLSPGITAQDIISPFPAEAPTYRVEPDYRKCAFPMCGGWFLTPVNQYSTQFESEEEAYENALLEPRAIYVAYLNYRQLRLKPEQVKELETFARHGQALLRGNLTRGNITPEDTAAGRSLDVNGAWVGANKLEAYGPYLKVASSGIMCITTPCPYYKAKLINTRFTATFDDLNLEKAELDREQAARAWQALSTDGLIMTGVKYESRGMTGPGTGIAATKVFFAYPEK